MTFLRFLSLLTLACWLGGLVALAGVGAPALFDVLESNDPAGGRVLAGALFGEIFSRFQHLAWILGGVLIALLILRAALGPRPRRFAIRLSAAAMMLALSLVGELALVPRIDAIRRGTHGAVAALADDDARKVEFGRLHGMSASFASLTLFAGVWLLWMEMRDQH